MFEALEFLTTSGALQLCCVLDYGNNMRYWGQTRKQMLWFTNDIFMCQVDMV